MQPRVLVGVTASFHKEYCLEPFLKGFNSLTYENKDVLFVENSQHDNYFNKLKSLGLNVIKGPYFKSPIKSISTSRNILIDKALNENYDYFFSLDQDTIPPKDAIERLISHNKQVTCGVCFSRTIIDGKVILAPDVYKIVPNTENKEEFPSMKWPTEEEIRSNKLIQVVSCGAGCLLLHKNVIKKIKFREDLEQSEDRWFCADLFKNNINIYCDTSVKCKHYILDRPYLWKQGKLYKKEDLIKK